MQATRPSDCRRMQSRFSQETIQRTNNGSSQMTVTTDQVPIMLVSTGGEQAEAFYLPFFVTAFISGRVGSWFCSSQRRRSGSDFPNGDRRCRISNIIPLLLSCQLLLSKVYKLSFHVFILGVEERFSNKTIRNSQFPVSSPQLLLQSLIPLDCVAQIHVFLSQFDRRLFRVTRNITRQRKRR